MKNKLIAILILCVACFVNAQMVPTIGKSAPREHRGAYSSTSFSFAFNWVHSSREDIDWEGNTIDRRRVDYFDSYTGSFSLAEFKHGVALGDFVAIHSVFNFGFFAGVMKYDSVQVRMTCLSDGLCQETVVDGNEYLPPSLTAYTIRTFWGLGATFYPLQKKPPFNGFFIGAAVGYTVFATLSVGDGLTKSNGSGGLGFQLEIGKEWWINDHYSIGFGLGFAHTGLVWETVKAHDSDNVISLSFRMTRG